jgi:hypothetical protein
MTLTSSATGRLGTSAAQLVFPELHEEIGMGPSSPAGVDPGIGPGERLQVLLSEKLPSLLVGTRIGIEGELGQEVPKLVGRHFQSETLSYRLHDRQ